MQRLQAALLAFAASVTLDTLVFRKAYSGEEPKVTDAALSTNGCFGDVADAILHDCKSCVRLNDYERINLNA